jgi:hypothetical protein
MPDHRTGVGTAPVTAREVLLLWETDRYPTIASP